MRSLSSVPGVSKKLASEDKLRDVCGFAKREGGGGAVTKGGKGGEG
jgi:hypothetical protein